MSEFRVQVVRVGPLEKHPNADRLFVTRVADYPVIVNTDGVKAGDLAIYVPVDAVVPDTERWAFLQGHRRIKARRLRGVFSMGLLVPADPLMFEGQDVAEALGIHKYEPPDEAETAADAERDPGFLPVIDIEGLRRHPGALWVGEEVVLTEKILGKSARFCFHNGRLWVASRTTFKRPTADTSWNQLARDLELEKRLAQYPGIAFYGENYGESDLKYGVERGKRAFRVFDVYDVSQGRFLDFDDAVTYTKHAGLEFVPVLFRGSWAPSLVSHAEGKTTLGGADHVREGFVVKPVRERLDDTVGRVAFKYHGEGYLTRKDG